MKTRYVRTNICPKRRGTNKKKRMKSSMDGNTLIHNVLFIDKVIIYWQHYKIINKYNIQQPGINLKCYYKV